MGHPNFVNVELRCRCGSNRTFCVRVDRNVPTPLRCAPGGGGGGGGGRTDICCPRCRESCYDSAGALEHAVNREIGSGGWGKHQRAGAVILEC